MLPLDKMLSVDLLIKDKRQYKTANIFGFIAYSDRNPYIAKVLKDELFWKSLGLKPKEYPQLVMLGIGSNRVMMQRNYPISDKSVDDAYASIEKNIDIVSAEIKRIYSEYKSSTHVYREVIQALDAELATEHWKRAAHALFELVRKLI